MFVEYYYFKDCNFRITKEDGKYWARCEEISGYSYDITDLKEVVIPMKYHSYRNFKL